MSSVSSMAKLDTLLDTLLCFVWYSVYWQFFYHASLLSQCVFLCNYGTRKSEVQSSDSWFVCNLYVWAVHQCGEIEILILLSVQDWLCHTYHTCNFCFALLMPWLILTGVLLLPVLGQVLLLWQQKQLHAMWRPSLLLLLLLLKIHNRQKQSRDLRETL